MDSKIHWLTPFLAMIIAAHATAGRVEVRVDAVLNEQNRMVGDGWLTLQGRAAEAMHAVLEGKHAAGRMRYFEQTLRETISDARLVDLDVDVMNRAEGGALRVAFSFYSDDAVSEGELGAAVLRMPSLASWVQPMGEGPGGGSHREAFLHSSFKETIRLDLVRSAFRVQILPELESVETAAGRVEQSLSLENDGVLLARTVLKRNAAAEAMGMDVESRLITVRDRNDRQRVILQREAIPDEAHLVVFDEQVRITLLEPGHWKEDRIREWGIMTADGVYDSTLLRFAYDPQAAGVRVESVAVRSPEGVIDILDPDAVSRKVQGSSPTETILTMDLPDLEVGSTVRTHLVLTYQARPFFSTTEHFSSSYPIQRKRVKVRYPKRSAVLHAVSGEGRVLKTSWEEDGDALIEWSARNMPAFTRGPVCPPDWMMSPVLFLSQADEDSVVDWVGRSVLRAASGTRALRRVAREKIEEATHRDEQIIALRDWVDREIEPVDPGRCGLSPDGIRAAGEILDAGSGTQVERMILLHALLDAMRLSPRMVLATALPRGTPLTAPPLQALQWDALCQLLVAIEGDDGETIYLDETGRHAPLGYTAHAGRPALDLQTGEWIYPRTLFSDRSDTLYQIRLEESGDADIQQFVRYFGCAAVRFHRLFETITPEERDRKKQRMIREMGGVARAGEAELHADLEGATIELAVRVPGFAIRQGDWMVVTVPPPSAGFFPSADLPGEQPVYLADAGVQAVIAEVQLPPGWRPVVLPPDDDMILPGRSVRLFTESRRQAGQVRWVVEFDRLPGVIASGEVARVMNRVDRLTRTPARTILLYREAP